MLAHDSCAYDALRHPNASLRCRGLPPRHQLSTRPPQARQLGKRGQISPRSCPCRDWSPSGTRGVRGCSPPSGSLADFRLDPDNACLWRGAQAIVLTPKAFEVLHYLVTHPDRLVTKDTLLDAVWPETAVSDAVVRIAIGELRRALGDTVRAPRFIATVPRRGYRFLASVTQTKPPDAASPASPAPPLAAALPLPASAGFHVLPASTPLVGREAVLVRLHAALAQARQGVRQFLCLTGEPGIGKTAVV